MSATAAWRGSREETAPRGPVSEPAWSWPIDLTRYDRTPTLSPEEADGLTALGQSGPGWWRPRQQRWAVRGLDRLVSPLAAVRATWSTHSRHQRDRAEIAVAALLGACAVEQAPYWAWAAPTWVRILGATRRAFQAAHPPRIDRQARHYLIALAYLLDCFTDLGQLGYYNRRALAEKVFGPARVGAAVERLASVLNGWGYHDVRKGKAFPRALCEVLLANRSPRLSDLTPALLDELRRGATVNKRAQLFQLQRALVALGLMDRPTRVGRRSIIEGVSATWLAWADRWESTSTLTPRARGHVRSDVLKAGRWLQVEHPAVAEPAAWTRELCAAYVAAVDRMHIGDFAQRCDPLGGRRGQPLSPRTKNACLWAMRQFFRDCQEWGWLPRRFDPARALATPRAVSALIGPRPRVIADEVWAKLLWAGLNLDEADLATSHHSCYPVKLVRALAITWLFAGLRSDEIVRLRVGCVRWQAARAEGAPDPVCLLDVPAHKTGAPFTKPVDALVGQAIEAWEAGRPTQPLLLDPRTGELVAILFCLRAARVARAYLNQTVIPVLCRKAGVPRADARGTITSHRARATIASQLYNAKEPMTLVELQAWLGHRSPLSTQHYTQITPTRLTQAYVDAGYFARNLRTVEVLIDREAVQNGTATAGTPWQYFDLGHGYCTYNFFEQCPHRMACARCDFYVPKGSTHAQLVEAKGHLQRMLTTIPLTEPERAAVEDGAAAVEQLLDRLADTPTPAGPTARELRGPQTTPLLTLIPRGPSRGA